MAAQVPYLLEGLPKCDKSVNYYGMYVQLPTCLSDNHASIAVRPATDHWQSHREPGIRKNPYAIQMISVSPSQISGCDRKLDHRPPWELAKCDALALTSEMRKRDGRWEM